MQNGSFTGSSRYVLDQELAKIVNISIALEMPLLLKGEPGTGKTMLAHAISESLGLDLIVLNVKSSMKLVEALYQYDTLTRLNDSRFGDSSRNVAEINDYIRMGKIGQAFVSKTRCVLLIDEIDKADSDFQDDMLDVLDQVSSISLRPTRRPGSAHLRPVVIITSNAKKDLLGPFLARCNFHHIAFPEPAKMHAQDRERPFSRYFPDAYGRCNLPLLSLRAIEGIEKKPATREFINWIRALLADPDFSEGSLLKKEIPYLGVLFKKSGDYQKSSQAVQKRGFFKN